MDQGAAPPAGNPGLPRASSRQTLDETSNAGKPVNKISVASAFLAALMTGSAATAADGYYFRAKPATFGAPLSAAAELAAASLPAAGLGQPWSFDFGTLLKNAPSGASAWSGRNLPAWMAVSAAGVATGTPTALGTAGFTVVASVGGKSVERAYSLAVEAASFRASAVNVGADFACAVTPSRAAVCWGGNAYGQLGIGSTTQRSTPGPAAIGSGVLSLSAGSFHVCAVLEGGKLLCWGIAGSGQLGLIPVVNRSSPPAEFTIASGVTAVASGGSHTCAIADGAVKCWGYNQYGQTGRVGMAGMAVPGSAAIPSGASAVAAGSNHSCALVEGGTVKCWGRNNAGQLGNGSTTDSNSPVIAVSSGATSVTAGNDVSCAVMDSGAVRCWGSGYGSSGGSSAPQANDPVTSGAVAVTAGYSNVCVTLSDGSAECWGAGSTGNNGDGTTAYKSKPTGLKAAVSGVSSVSIHESAACAVVDGSVSCWGRNNRGQVGDGTTVQRNVPTAVVPGT
jgi:alpha-tubulin suppressor-like RCC1 family protein